MNDGINYLSTGAGFLPSTVCEYSKLHGDFPHDDRHAVIQVKNFIHSPKRHCKVASGM